MKTEVTFCTTAFNCSEPKDYFINECCFGDDVCRWLIGQLRAQGLRTAEEPDQEDFGWYFTFSVEGAEHCFVVGFQPNDSSAGDCWLGWVERHRSFFGSLFGRRKRGILPDAIRAINLALSSSPVVHEISWHEPGATKQVG